MSESAWTFVAQETLVPQGEGRRMKIGGFEIALFRTAEGWFALDNACPHKQGPLADGIVAGKSVFCPMHAWKIDLACGKAVSGGEGCVKTYPVKVEGGKVYIRIDLPKGAGALITFPEAPAAAEEEQEELKEVIAIVRPEKWRATQQALFQAGALGVSQNRVLGRGRQAGLRYATGQVGVMGYLPKRMVTCVVPSGRVKAVVDSVIQANQTGNPGDGRVFVCPIGDAVRVRTGERGLPAVSH